MSWVMGALAAQDEYKPLPWGSDPWQNRLGPTREMIAQREAEAASQRADQAYRDQQAANADETQAYRGMPRLDPGLQRRPGSVAPTPAAAFVGELGGDMLTDPTSYIPGATMATRAGRAVIGGLAANAAMEPTEAEAMLGGPRGAGRANPKLLQALERAKDMEQAGRTAGDIWRDAGWERFKDGRWRYEIPGGSGTMKQGMGKLADLWKHPQLWKAYPDMAEMPASIGVLTPDYFGPGVLHPTTRAAYAHPIPGKQQEQLHLFKGISSPKVSLQHEGTHGIQTREGFAPGASPMSAQVRLVAEQERAARAAQMEADYKHLDERRFAWLDEYAKANGVDPNGVVAAQAWRQQNPLKEDMRKAAFNNWYNLAHSPVSFNDRVDAYRRWHGEVEARAVPTRDRMKAADRKNIQPGAHLHFETPYDRQIVNYEPQTEAFMGALLGTGR